MWVDAKNAKEDRRELWSSRTLMESSESTSGLTLMFTTFLPGGNTPLHSHDQEEYLFAVSGNGKITIDGQEIDLVPDRMIRVKKQAKHQVKNGGNEPLKLFRIYAPSK